MEYKIIKNLASFPDGEWSPDHTKMSKGITLSQEVMRILAGVMSGLDLTGDEVHA